MKSNRLKVVIHKPAEQVFAFVLNPSNTPKWIDSIVTEETNEWPPKLGTIYKNQNRAGEWTEYEMSEFNKNKMFVLSDRRAGYHVKYTLKPTQSGSELEYYEWMDEGELEAPFTQAYLDKLKAVIEA